MTPTCPKCGHDLTALELKVVGRLSVEDGGNRIYWDKTEVKLTRSERLLVLGVVRLAGRTLSWDAVCEAAVGEDCTDPKNIANVLVSRIRHNFRKVDLEFDQLETVWGVGLRWRADNRGE